MSTRVDETEFVALTGCALSSTIIAALLTAADRAVDTELSALGDPSLPDDTLHDASMLFAKALLADRKRFDGTFDVSTTEYSHKGGTETTIANLRAEAKELLRTEAMNNLYLLKKTNE